LPSRRGYLGLGSNVGDRNAQLRAAVEMLAEAGIEIEAASSTYELEPEELLDVCKRVEAERGRALDGPRHGPRPIDVDLLLLGDIELETERLTLPHREVRSRRFVLVPLLELDPDLTLPDGTRLADALAALGPGQRVVRAGSL
jgi:7,8-dihydro-6-hydroxymethylpterin-pyrophosphokinase